MHDLLKILSDHILHDAGFASAIFNGRTISNSTDAWEKIVIKPVLLKDVLHYQFNYFDTVKSTTKNYKASEAKTQLTQLASSGFKNIYVRNATSGLQIQVNKKGKLFLREHKALPAQETNLAHDRQKNKIIKADSENAYLNALGFLDAKGHVKPTMQAKLKQINEFVKLLADLQDWSAWDKPVYLVDCGSGNAYLTFAAFHYFQDVLGKETHMTGIDINAGLIENSNARAKALGWDNLTFEVSAIGGYTPDVAPTVTLALHACDTATDEALMKAVQWQSEFILSVPCCHHNLQERLKAAPPVPTFKGVFKHGILRERTGDILTDALRALLLEIMGYKTDVIQFVTTEHTARNLMIRAKKVSTKPLDGAIHAYRAMTDFWGVTPALEEKLLLGTGLKQYFQQ